MPATETNQDERLKSPQIIQGTKATRYPVSSNRRAKTTAAWSSGTTTTANLLDADGNEITEGSGAGITVNFFETYSANNFPPIPDDKTIPVFLDINDEWYCLWSFITAVDVDNVLVEFNINTSTYKFQTKKRDNVMVLAAGDVSGYVDEHTGTVCP